MAQHDYNIANASFPTVRTDINNVLSAINSSNSGSSRPSSAVAGTIWLDTSGAATAQLLKMYDGAADITLATVNFTANTVDFSDSAVAITGLATSATGTVLTLTDTDIDIPANVGLTFGDDGEKIEGNGTDLTISGNDIILDAADNVIIDSDTGTLFKDGGTHFATLSSSNGISITCNTSNADILLRGNDNGSFITALTLDMSSAGAATFNAAANVTQQALTSSSNAVAWNAIEKPNAVHITTENTTFSAPSNPVEGAFIALEINYNGSHTIAFNTVFEFAASTAPTFTSADGKTDILVFRYNGAVWQEVGRTLNLSES